MWDCAFRKTYGKPYYERVNSVATRTGHITRFDPDPMLPYN